MQPAKRQRPSRPQRPNLRRLRPRRPRRRTNRLRSVHARYVLPAALAARLGLDQLAYRLYRRMIDELAGEFAPEQKWRESQSRALSL